jgi:6-phosphogluconate dehydrogenase
MELAMIGLGAMGERMALRLVRDHRLVVFDLDPATVERLGVQGATQATDIRSLVAGLAAPRAVWLMLPSGAPTERTIQEVTPFLGAGDVVIDGGNSHYRDSMRRASLLEERGIHLLDVGTSGGVAGGERGYSLMVGGPEPVVARLEPIFRSLAADPDHGWGRVGVNGAGHFAKMVHNGIEYGLMRAYAQGLEALAAKSALGLDLKTVTGVWRGGAMARSAILDLTHEALAVNPDLGPLAPYVADAGVERWTLEEAIDQMAQRGFDRDQFA